MKIRKNDVTMQRLDFAMDSLCYDTTLLRNSYIAFKKVACKYFMNKDAYHEIFWKIQGSGYLNRGKRVPL